MEIDALCAQKLYIPDVSCNWTTVSACFTVSQIHFTIDCTLHPICAQTIISELLDTFPIFLSVYSLVNVFVGTTEMKYGCFFTSVGTVDSSVFFVHQNSKNTLTNTIHRIRVRIFSRQ
jgi:hypothetical protein